MDYPGIRATQLERDVSEFFKSKFSISTCSGVHVEISKADISNQLRVEVISHSGSESLSSLLSLTTPAKSSDVELLHTQCCILHYTKERGLANVSCLCFVGRHRYRFFSFSKKCFSFHFSSI